MKLVIVLITVGGCLAACLPTSSSSTTGPASGGAATPQPRAPSQTAPSPKDNTPSAPSVPSAPSAPSVPSAPNTVTFAKDLAPLLNSTATGMVYKCTTCHAQYAKASGLNTASEIALIVSQLQSGRMPLMGDPMPPAQIGLFLAWEQAGFPVGQASPN